MVPKLSCRRPQLRDLTCQWCVFEEAATPFSNYDEHQLINVDALESLTQLVLYMSDNIGVLSLPKAVTYVQTFGCNSML